MAFATASSPANRKPGDNAQTATPPQAQARPRQSPGKAEPPTRARAPACARARQRAPGPQRMPGPRRVLGRKPSSGALTEPSIGLPNVDRAKRQALVALAKPSPQRAPDPPERARTPSAPAPGARQDETGLQSVNQAEQRVPGALAKPAPSARQPPRCMPGRKPGSGALPKPSSEFPRRGIAIFVQPRSKETILRRLRAKTRDSSRYRKAHTRTNDKNVHLSLPRPRKTVCFDRQRPKLTVFRIPHPTDSQPHSQQATLPSPISAMEGFFARLKNADNGNRVLPPSRLVRRDDSRLLPHSQRLPQVLQ